jgi:hypothetical protein
MEYEISVSDRKTYLHIRVNEPAAAELSTWFHKYSNVKLEEWILIVKKY